MPLRWSSQNRVGARADPERCLEHSDMMAAGPSLTAEFAYPRSRTSHNP